MNITTRGSGNIISEDRHISNLTGVQLNTSGDLILSQGDAESLTIEADDNILPLLTSEVVNGTLKLSTQPNTNISPSKPIKYTLVVKNISALSDTGSGSITASDLNLTNPFSVAGSGSGQITLANVLSDEAHLSLSGSGSLTAASLKAPKTTISINGSGSAAISLLDTQSVNASLSGNGILQLVGTTGDATVSVSGSGDFKGEQLLSKTANTSSNGSGDITLQVSDTLVASSNGSGNVTYIGNPSVTQRRNGSGKIIQKS